MLEALVEPSARIAPGYGIVSLTLQNGQTVAGMLREETESHLVVQTGSGETRQVATSEITQRVNAPSAMPPMGQLLSRREIRDVVEYLSTLR